MVFGYNGGFFYLFCKKKNKCKFNNDNGDWIFWVGKMCILNWFFVVWDLIIFVKLF